MIDTLWALNAASSTPTILIVCVSRTVVAQAPPAPPVPEHLQEVPVGWSTHFGRSVVRWSVHAGRLCMCFGSA
jgi:hypothetical protein